MTLAIDNPILNSPFDEPTSYWDYKEGQPVLAEWRRSAGYYLRPSTRGSHAALGFLDARYSGMTFHICQAFFPGDANAWDKLQRALKAQIDPEAFEQMRGTVSFPFKLGEHNRIALKVIDFRGNEVVRVVKLQ